MHAGLRQMIEASLIRRTGRSGSSIFFEPIGGGSINDAYRVSFSGYLFFCKVNSASLFPQLFQKEESGLQLIACHHCIRTPQILDRFEWNAYQVLLMEWIEPGIRTESFWPLFGEQLAALHGVKGNVFGLDEDNYMGSLPQSNSPTSEWNDFFANQRIRPLLQKASAVRLLSTGQLHRLDRLLERLSTIFDEGQPPVLLHGDLWSGNFICNANEAPVLIDPAVYFGHPSMDLAMSTLFGGFKESFYEAYHHHSPLPPNYQEQWKLCNLYPLLVHLLLFGTSYLPQVENILSDFD